jgi:hypothetical protein
MAAPKGNQYALGCATGRDKIFKTPDELLTSFLEYKKEVNGNPWIKHEAIKSGEFTGQLISIPLQRPYTLKGFSVFCGISYQGLFNYGHNESYNEFFEVYNKIETECDVQKFEGASVGAFNASIIARDLGLTDKQDITTQGEKITSKIDLTKFTDDELRLIAELQRKSGVS